MTLDKQALWSCGHELCPEGVYCLNPDPPPFKSMADCGNHHLRTCPGYDEAAYDRDVERLVEAGREMPLGQHAPPHPYCLDCHSDCRPDWLCECCTFDAALAPFAITANTALPEAEEVHQSRDSDHG